MKKAKIVFITCMVILSLTIGCKSEEDKENAKLKRQVDSLREITMSIEAEQFESLASKLKSAKSFLDNKIASKKAFASAQIDTTSAKNLDSFYRYSDIIEVPLAWTFSKENMNTLLNTPGIDGVKFYAGKSATTNKLTLLAVGIYIVPKPDGTEEMNDFIGTGTNSFIFDFADPCPPKCSKANRILMISGEENVTHQFKRTALSAASRASINPPSKKQE